MKKTIQSTLVLYLLFFGIFSLNAQPILPEPPKDDNPVPISGVGYLIAAGAALGVKKIYDNRRK